MSSYLIYKVFLTSPLFVAKNLISFRILCYCVYIFSELCFFLELCFGSSGCPIQFRDVFVHGECEFMAVFLSYILHHTCTFACKALNLWIKVHSIQVISHHMSNGDGAPCGRWTGVILEKLYSLWFYDQLSRQKLQCKTFLYTNINFAGFLPSSTTNGCCIAWYDL